MTNISYLNPPLTIIECFGRGFLSASFMQISINLGFPHFGIISEDENSEQCMLPDAERLELIMEEIGA